MRVQDSAHPKYRPDIDGLRAIAVISVIWFHLYTRHSLPGGFIGVDIFFVISGYLISLILLQNLRQGTYSIADFYARRVRRIFPALAIMLAAVLTTMFFCLWPGDVRAISLQALAGIGFVSNLLQWSQAGYFDEAAKTKPLLHLWSLGVEEQFYIFWPLLLWLGFKLHMRPALLCGLLFAVSLILNLLLIDTHAVADFYSPFTRMWELLAGTGLAIYTLDSHPRPPSPITSDLLCFSGLSLIAYGMFFFHEGDPFPGWRALVPVIGSALIILAGMQARLNRYVLGNPVMRGIGLISYPLYLWHMPLLVFPRLLAMHHFQLPALVLTLVLAIFTYFFIEQPFRTGRFKPHAVRTLSWVMLLLAILSAVGYFTDGFAFRYPPFIAQIASINEVPRAQWRTHECFADTEDSEKVFTPACLELTPRPLIFLWGDSHAAALYPGIRHFASAHHMGVAQYTSSACPPFVEGAPANPHFCGAANRVALEAIRRAKPEFVVLAARWARYPSENLAPTVTELRRIGIKHIVLIGPNAEWNMPLPRAIATYWLKHSRQLPPLYMRDYLDETIPALDTQMHALATRLGIDYISPYQVFCTAQGCLTRFTDSPDQLTAFDEEHFSPAASIYFIQQFDHGR